MTSRAMQEPTFLILTALAAGPQHGYGIITDVVRISAERVRLRAGTLYAALDRLQAEGLVAADREEVVDGRARRHYRLTPEGELRLAAEAEQLRHNAETATARLRGRAAWQPGGGLGSAFAGPLGAFAGPPGALGGPSAAFGGAGRSR
ncbi:helix-turn-helix transcriptional regulator [Nonomuraea sp. NPDC049607]|uniref:PadR family transcriptional regulator n=1 Tax=Nonomuraea sp. NPDC049607 TaxID=3154732 RepID=UPI0034301C62